MSGREIPASLISALEEASDKLRDKLMHEGLIPAVEIAPCPFCGKAFLKPAIAYAPVALHPGVTTDGVDDCALSGMGFREEDFVLLNRRAA